SGRRPAKHGTDRRRCAPRRGPLQWPGGEAGSPVAPMSEKFWFLKRCDLFERLTPAERQRLEGRAVMRTFRPRAAIYLPTEPGQSVLVLARGRVKIKALAPDGRETTLAF